jgi:starvation-inducible DNA-binding protein
MKTNIGLTDSHRKSIVTTLSTLLADEVVLSIRTRNYHWNVEGLHFNDLHKVFGAQYEEIDAIVDEVAERIRQLGHKTPATLGEFLKHTSLKENPLHPGAKEMVSFLLFDHESIVRELRTSIDAVAKLNDQGTADFLTGLLEQHEKMAWMLRATATE